MAEKKEKAVPAATGKSNTALESVLSQIRKEFGELSILRLGEDAHADIPVIPTGALSLDLALGVGGLPRGRIVECYGQESSGKTTLALHVVANAQKAGGIAAFIDGGAGYGSGGQASGISLRAYTSRYFPRSVREDQRKAPISHRRASSL